MTWPVESMDVRFPSASKVAWTRPPSRYHIPGAPPATSLGSGPCPLIPTDTEPSRRMSYSLRRRARWDARKGTPISVASLPRNGEAVKHPGHLPEELASEVGPERLCELERVRLRDVAAVEEGDRVVYDERAEVAVA